MTDLPSLTQILYGSSPPTNSQPVIPFAVPGQECRYSGGGTMVVQKLIEDITGKNFSDLAQEFIFDPLEMKSTGYEIHRPTEKSFNAALGHDVDGRAKEGGWVLHPEFAAAGLWSNPFDLACFVNEINKAYKGESKILSRELVLDMLTIQPNSSYGLGPVLSAEDPSEFSHEAATEGYRAHFVGFAKTGKGAVIMTNSDSGWELIPEILQSIAETYGWPARDYIKIKRPASIDSDILKNYVNDFEVQFDQPVKFAFTTEDNKLFISFPFPDLTSEIQKFELTPESNTAFFYISDKLKLEISFPSAIQKAEEFKFLSSPFGKREGRKIIVPLESKADTTQEGSHFNILITTIEKNMEEYKKVCPKAEKRLNSLEAVIREIKKEKNDDVVKLKKLIHIIDTEIKNISSYVGLRWLYPDIAETVYEKALKILPQAVLNMARQEKNKETPIPARRL